MKNKSYDKVYQFKVLLEGSKPPIWRRIQVPENFTFEDLHKTIQLAMGWCDCHLHQFATVELSQNYRDRKFIKIPHPEDDDFNFGETFDERKEKIADWFSLDEAGKTKMKYEYDFGDDWHHMITLEEILPKEDGVKYPRVIKGKGACPPEDIGGIWGYTEIVEALKNPKSKESQSFFKERFGSFKDFEEWLEDSTFIKVEDFDPEEYEIEDDGYIDLKGYISMSDY